MMLAFFSEFLWHVSVAFFKEKCQKYDRPKCTEDDVLVRVRRRRHSLLTSDTDQFNLLPANIGVQA